METAPHLGGMLKSGISLDAPFNTFERKLIAKDQPCESLRSEIKLALYAVGDNHSRLLGILKFIR